MISNLRGLTFDDVILVPNYNGIRSRQLVTTKVEVAEVEFDLPVCSSNMDTVTGPEMANLMNSMGAMSILHRFSTVEENVKMFRETGCSKKVGISIGVGNDGLARAEALIGEGAEIVCVDVAHGHTKEVNRTVKALRESFRDNIMIVAGNVATYSGADYLAAAGADVIKVGIGCGSVCTTRIKTGFGVPQLTAIQNCSKVDCAIIADGGIRFPADAVKALAAGADMVMVGGLLAGTDETPGVTHEKLDESGKPVRFKKYRGMASQEAQDDFMGGMSEWKTAEGVQIELECRGSAKAVVRDIMGGIRSGMTYCGAKNIRDLQRKVRFMEITPSGQVEGTPHAVGRL